MLHTWVEMVKPGGTGNLARHISASPAPLPPSVSFIFPSPSAVSLPNESELRERLVASGLSAGEIDVRTFHGFSARVIGGGVAAFLTTRLLDGFSRELVLEAAIEQTPTPAIGDAARSSRALRMELGTLLDS